MSYNTANYEEQGGANQVIGGTLQIASGGSIDVEAGGALKIGGTQVNASADEINLNDLSAVGALVKVKKIAVAAGDWSTETDSGWDLPAKALVLDVFVDVTTLQAGKTVDIGLKSGESGGDADGFANDLSLAAAGIVRPGYALDAGSAYFASATRGALLTSFAAGTNADDRGLYAEKPHPSTAVTAKSVTYTTNTAVTAVFNIYIVYIELG